MDNPLDRAWAGATPFFLLIVKDGQQHIVDVDESGWLKTYAHLLRGEMTWHLIGKDGVVVFSLVVAEGEQPYYTARHIGRGLLGASPRQREIVAHGIGKKRLDGHVDRLWVLPSGQVCAGDDVYALGRALLAGPPTT